MHRNAHAIAAIAFLAAITSMLSPSDAQGDGFEGSTIIEVYGESQMELVSIRSLTADGVAITGPWSFRKYSLCYLSGDDLAVSVNSYLDVVKYVDENYCQATPRHQIGLYDTNSSRVILAKDDGDCRLERGRVRLFKVSYKTSANIHRLIDIPCDI